MVQLAASRDSRNSFMKPTDGSLLRVGLDQSLQVGSGKIAMTRLQLNDGRTYRIVKIFYEPSKLQESSQSLGLLGHVHYTENYFLYGLFYPTITA
jgi:outer membrane protein assembly factor BamA